MHRADVALNTSEIFLCVIAAALVGCGTIEDNAWTNGVSRDEALEIKVALHAAHHECDKIESYSRNEDGTVSISADCGTWNAKRVRGHWEFTPTVVTS